ncbi:MAG: bifunctional phosphopantothenoylcysteine decarboxylase/phosphopantothenate--cysteine ligase CoaBC [Actinomycetales bacterium]
MITFPSGREILLGVGGGIAAYKSCDLLRRLQDFGNQVSVLPTENSLNFVGKVTWEALSGREVFTDLWEKNMGVTHIELAKRSELIVVGPATADLIAKIATGRADDLLTTTILASKAPLLLIPAMHPEMYLNQATQENLEIIRSRGIHVMEPAVGKLTGGDSGIGRYPETSEILKFIDEVFGGKFTKSDTAGSKLSGKRVVVTAGGTREPIDAVRYIGNRSSGRQGLSIAYEARRRGADVLLVIGESEEFNLPGVSIKRADSASEMLSYLMEEVPVSDCLVMSAAVADARPSQYSNEKIEKGNFLQIQLEQNPDILKKLSGNKKTNQIFVGFAAETNEDYLQRGMKKLHEKGVDLLYVTDVSGGKVFGELQTTGSLLSKNGQKWDFEDASKMDVASKICDQIEEQISLQDSVQ